MAIASSQQSFLSNAFITSAAAAAAATHKSQNRGNKISILTVTKFSCRFQPDDSPRKNENQLAKLAIVTTLAAGLLTIGSVDPASAAKTGGRVGGQAFRSSSPPRSSSPRINNSRTNVYINPPVAPPLVGGYGYGYGVPFYGGWGWSPFSFFAPGPSVSAGIGGGFETLAFFLFLGAAAAAVRRFFGSRLDDDDDDY